MSETMSMVFAPLGSWEVLCETGGDFLRIKTIYPFTVTRDVEPAARHQVAQWIRVENLPETVTEEILTPNRERLYSGQTRAFLRRLRGHLDAGEVTSFGDATVVDYQDRKNGFHPARNPGLVLSEPGLIAHAARQLATSPEAPLSTRPRYLRPNGDVYFGRQIGEVDDVTVLQTAISNGLTPYLYGDPGCGKTALVEAAFCGGLETVVGSGDTDEASFVGTWVQVERGFQWLDGPLVRAMKNGSVLFVDEVGLIDARVISLLNPLLDGRGTLHVQQNPQMPPVEAAPGFAIVFAGNPHAVGVRMSEALISRLTFPILVETDVEVLPEIGVLPEVVDLVRTLIERRSTNDISWSPQVREAIAVSRIWSLFGPQQGANALVSLSPERARNQVVLTIQSLTGLEADVIKVSV